MHRVAAAAGRFQSSPSVHPSLLIRQSLSVLAFAGGLCIAGCSKSTTGLALSYQIVRGADQSGEAGTALNPIVIRVTDSRGNPHSGTMLHAEPRPGGSVSPQVGTSGANGEVSFVWTLGSTVGGHELMVEDPAGNSRFSVYAVARAPAVASISVTPTSANLSAGQMQQFFATVRDAQGQELNGRVVTWTSSHPAVASVGGFTGLVTALAGGTTTITATSETRSASATVSVASGPPFQLVVTTEPSGAAAGSQFTVQPVVEVRDAAGGVSTTGPVAVTAQVQSGPGTLSGTTTVQSVNGVATFTNLSVSATGFYTLIFTAPGLIPATTATFFVADASTAAVTITTLFLANGTQGVAYNATLTASGGTGNYTWSITSGGLPPGISLSSAGVLSGTPTGTGTSAFTVQAASSGITGTRNLTLTILPASGGQTPTHLTVGTQPGGAVSGANFTVQPTVVVRDAQGALVLGSSVPVTASIASGSGILSGTTTVIASNGVATFTNLRITGSGVHTLSFSSPGLAGATSGTFTVAAGGGGNAGLNVGASTPASVAAGANIDIPIILDMSASGGANVASIQFGVTWDPAKFDFVSAAVNGGSGFALTPNTDNSGTGSISVAGFAVTGVTTTTTLYTITLTARPAAAGGSGVVAATVGAAADQLGVPVTITPRNLVVNITP